MEYDKRSIANLSHASFTGVRAPEPFTSGDLPLLPDGRVYHLQLKADELAANVILVGDPGRVPKIATSCLDFAEVDRENRGLRSITGVADGVRLSIITSGMGTSSEEIVLQELQILNEIDPKTRTRRSSFPPLTIIRVGTSGGLQAGTPLGTPIISTYAVGMDNAGVYYDVPYFDDVCERVERSLQKYLEHAMPRSGRFSDSLRPYVAQADPRVVNALTESARELGIDTKTGITASNSGFFAAQGRHIARIAPSLPDLDQLLGDFDPALGGQRIENMEMEASLLFHFGQGIGYRTGAICPTVANRRADTFKLNYETDVEAASRIAVLALKKLAANL